MKETKRETKEIKAKETKKETKEIKVKETKRETKGKEMNETQRETKEIKVKGTKRETKEIKVKENNSRTGGRTIHFFTLSPASRRCSDQPQQMVVWCHVFYTPLILHELCLPTVRTCDIARVVDLSGELGHAVGTERVTTGEEEGLVLHRVHPLTLVTHRRHGDLLLWKRA